MPAGKAFLDSNVVLYLVSADEHKAARAEHLLAKGNLLVSVQVLNEVTSVCRRKLGMGWIDTTALLEAVRAHCDVEPLTLETHETGLRLAGQHKLSVYDAMIAASALISGCSTLWSEDMHDGLVLDKRLKLRNPFS